MFILKIAKVMDLSDVKSEEKRARLAKEWSTGGRGKNKQTEKSWLS